jgi:hypothetical protein
MPSAWWVSSWAEGGGDGVVGSRICGLVEVAMAQACVGYKDGFHAKWIKGE